VTVVTLAKQACDFYALDPVVERVALGLAGESSGLRDALANNLRRVVSLRQVLRRNRSDVAIGIMTTANVLLALAGVGFRRMVLAGSEQVYPPRFPLPPVWNHLRRLGYSRLDVVVAPTHESARWIAEHTRARRTVVIPNPIVFPLPDQPPHVDPSAVGAPGKRRVLAVGRLAPQKGFDLLLLAWARLASRFPAWELVIVGEGPERAALDALAGRLGVRNSVWFPGLVGNVGQWYGSAEVYVMSSRFEGFGNSLAEALAYGIPAVSFDCESGPRAIVRHGVDGFVVPHGDVTVFAETLARVMGDEGLRQSLARRATEARDRFSVGRVAKEWETLFEETLSGKRFG
jgi:glycosyltransferase involved in cell wall biosynthesis